MDLRSGADASAVSAGEETEVREADMGTDYFPVVTDTVGYYPSAQTLWR